MKFLRIEWKNKVYGLWAEKEGERLWIHYQGTTWQWIPSEKVADSDLPPQNLKNVISAPMPGRIIKLPFKKGAKVNKGDVLLVLSAMKMEYSFRAETEGCIEKVLCKVGDQVDSNQILIRVKYV